MNNFWSQIHNCIEHLLLFLTIIWFHTPYVLCLFTMFCFVVWLLIDTHPFFSFSFSILWMMIMFTILHNNECTCLHMVLFFERYHYYHGLYILIHNFQIQREGSFVLTTIIFLTPMVSSIFGVLNHYKKIIKLLQFQKNSFYWS